MKAYRMVGASRFGGRRARPSKVERLYVGVSMLCMSSGINLLVADPISLADKLGGGSVNFAARMLAFPAFIYALWVFLKFPKRFLSAIRASPFILILLGLCLLSLVWTLNFEATSIRLALLLATTSFGVALATRYSRSELMRMIGYVCVCLVAIQILSALVTPGLGVHQDNHYPAVRGMFLHKNAAGQTLLLAVIAGVVLSATRQHRIAGLVFIGAGALGVLLAMSVTAALVGVCVVGGAGLLRFWQSHVRLTNLLAACVIVTVGAAAYSGLATSFIGSALETLGRDLTLTNRTIIWGRLIEVLWREAPLFGFGYEGFWNSPAGVLSVFNERYYVPGHAHNGIIHTWTNTGLAGVTVLIVGLILLARERMRVLRIGADPLYRFDILFLAYFVLTNMAEVSVLRAFSLVWAIFVCLACKADEPVTRASLWRSIPREG
jgi:exopolysaccharide production protein ExoQ